MPGYRPAVCAMVAFSCLASASAMLRRNSPSTQGAFKAVVFDFDCTFSQEHLWKTTHNPSKKTAWMQKYDAALANGEFELAAGGKPVWKSPTFDSWIMGGSQRIAMLKSYFQAWKDSGVSVEICTWSEPDRVDDVLKGTGLYDLVTAVHGKTTAGNLVRRDAAQATYENRGQESKQKWLGVRAAELGGRVLFADDTADNYNGLPDSVEAYRDPNLVKDGPGLTQDMMAALSQTLGVAPPVPSRSSAPPLPPRSSGPTVPPRSSGPTVPPRSPVSLGDPPVPPRSAVSLGGTNVQPPLSGSLAHKCCCGFFKPDVKKTALIKGYAGSCNANGKPSPECMEALLHSSIRKIDIPTSFHAQGARCSSDDSQAHAASLVMEKSKCCCGKLSRELVASLVPGYVGQCNWDEDPSTEQCKKAVEEKLSPLKPNELAVEVRHWGAKSCREAQSDVEDAAMAKLEREHSQRQ